MKGQLRLRCYLEQQGDIWSAVCIDLNLAAQGDSSDEARSKLHEQVKEYVYDAVQGADKEFAAQLLNRKAPLSLRFKYHMISLRCTLSDWFNNDNQKPHNGSSDSIFQEHCPT